MAAKVTIMVGFVPISTKIEPAVDSESSGAHAVCTGTSEAPHDPARVKTSVGCTVCDIKHTSVFGFPKRGIERGDKLVVLDAEDITQAAGEPRTGRANKPPIQVAFHPREKVFAATVAGDSVQNIYPDKGAGEAYTLLRDTLASHPDIVACMIWAPTSKNALWTLEVVGERIVATKRAWPEQVRPTMSLPEVEPSEMHRAMFTQLIETTVEDFDLMVYVDESKRSLDELVASRAGVPGAVAPHTTGVTQDSVPDLLANLEASLAAAGAKPSKPAKKAAPRKKAAPVKGVATKKAAPRKRPAKKAAAPLTKAG